ncbi:MAG TPA: hypothetical protein VK543_04055 [Puia sp.]|nr:hypothetical protein [Puia sp.]
MKKMLVVLFAIGLSLGAIAQRGHSVGHGFYYRPRVVIGLGAYAPFYPYYGFGYSPFYPYPGYGYGYGHYPSKLDRKIADIKSDYADKINSAKSDNTLSRKERRSVIHNLKRERDQAIDDLKRNYYKS